MQIDHDDGARTGHLGNHRGHEALGTSAEDNNRLAEQGSRHLHRVRVATEAGSTRAPSSMLTSSGSLKTSWAGCAMYLAKAPR